MCYHIKNAFLNLRTRISQYQEFLLLIFLLQIVVKICFFMKKIEVFQTLLLLGDAF